MWCPSCRQDVPGVPGAVDSRFGCPRCGTLLAVDAGIDLENTAANASGLEAALQAPSPSVSNAERPVFEPIEKPRAEPVRISSLRWDAANWELNEKLRHVERVAATARRRFDGPHSAFTAEAPPTPHVSPSRPSHPAPAYPSPEYAPEYAPAEPYGPHQPLPTGPHQPTPFEWNQAPSMIAAAATFVSWLFLGTAVAAFTCGGFLAAWGAVANRPSLEHLGMPFLIGGMFSLLLGLLPQSYLCKGREQLERRRASSADSDSPANIAAPHFSGRRTAARRYERLES